MATAATTDNRVYLYRLLTLNIDYGTAVVRNLIDDQCSNNPLTTLLARERRTIINLRANRNITKVQFDLLFPQSGISPTTADFDLTLALCLLRSLKPFGLNSKYTWNVTPQPADISLEADLCRLRIHRNELAHISSTQGLQETDYQDKWADIEGALHRLNCLVQNPIQDLQQIIDDCKTGPLDPEAEKEIEKQIETMQKFEEKIEVEMQSIKTGFADVNKRVEELEKYTESEGTQKSTRSETPTFFQDIYRRLTYWKRKKELKEELTEYYKRKYSTIPLSPLFEEHNTSLVDFYVMPEMNIIETQKKEPVGEETKTPVESLSHIFKPERNNCCEVYLTADAGFGKTAFSKYLAVTWCQAHRSEKKYKKYFSKDAINAVREFEFLFLVLLRDSSGECSIDDLIFNKVIQDLSRCSSMTMDSLKDILHREKCLIILDGLDEWTHPEKECKRVPKTIPHRNAREKCVILTTTRPWKLGVLNLKAGEIGKKVELVKLTSKSAQILEERAISKIKKLDVRSTEGKIQAQQLNAKVKENKLEDLESVPLLTLYLICLWCENIPLGQSKCELYSKIIELLLSRAISKHPEVEQTCQPSQCDTPKCFRKQVYCTKYGAYLTALGTLAFETLFSETKEYSLVFDKSVADKFLSSPGYLQLSLDTGLLTQSTVRTLTSEISKCSFSHKSVQEFFCALYISCQNESDVRDIVLKDCKSLQSILDMSTVFVFISGMVNAEIISSISHEFMSVINADEITSKYRSTTDYICQPLENIQNMYISCMKESPEINGNPEIKLVCEDFFFDENCKEEKYFTYLKRLSGDNKNNIMSININTGRGPCLLREIIDSAVIDRKSIDKIRYQGGGEEDQLLILLNRSTKSLSVRSPDLDGSWNREMWGTNLQNNSRLQAIHIYGYTMSHDVLNKFVNFINNNKHMTEIRLSGLYCREHRRACSLCFNLVEHFQLSALVLIWIPEVSQLTVNSQVKDVVLWDINLSERWLPREMVNLESVLLYSVNMSASTFRHLVKTVEKLSHKVTVTIGRYCKIEPREEFELVKQYIHTSQYLRVEEDDDWFQFATEVDS